MNFQTLVSQATVASLCLTDSTLEKACLFINEQVPFYKFAVPEDADEFSLYKLRKLLGLKGVNTFEEFCERLIPVVGRRVYGLVEGQ